MTEGGLRRFFQKPPTCNACLMNWDQIEGTGTQGTGSAKPAWDERADDETDVVADKRDQLACQLRERQALARDEPDRPKGAWIPRA